MDQSFTIEMADLPIAGGLTEDPSVLRSVNDFLARESHLRKVNQLLQEDGCVIEYRSLIDCVLAELMPQFKDACFEFYEGKGKPLASLHPAEAIAASDAELGLALEVLVSQEWSTWENFKSNYKRKMEWEPL
jgi:hypothetical protein